MNCAGVIPAQGWTGMGSAARHLYPGHEMVFDGNTLGHGTDREQENSSAHLVVIRGMAGRPDVDLESGEVSIGRQADNLLVLDSEKVSRRHARVIKDGPHYFVEDLGSFNGTFVNGRKLEPRQRRQLRHLDVLQLSDCQLLFQDYNVLATQLGLSIHLDQEQIRKEAIEALENFRDRDTPT